MKVCNNCGWFNQDSAVSCVKCNDTSFKQIADAATDEGIPSSCKVENHTMATVAFEGATPIVSKQFSEQKKFKATVLDAEDFVQREKSCEKCRYPIVGNVDCCPNCGATLHGSTDSAQNYISGDTNDIRVQNLKATIRDASECVDFKVDVFKLVPVDVSDEHSLEMKIGDIVTIGGCRYRFQR